MPRYQVLIFLLLILSQSVSALPPEALENFGQLVPGKGSNSVYVFGGYHDPVWRSQWAETGAYIGLPAGGNYLSFGARGSTAPNVGDRDAYFIRYDLIMGTTSSLGFKAMHEDWRYIATAKETLGFDYNVFFPVGQARSGLFITLGGYYRWMKQRWNDQWWNPTNLQTPDQEGYAQGLFGYAQSFGKTGSYFTFDVNYRDPYSYYHFDNAAFDFTLNLAFGPKFIVRFFTGMRTAAVYMGAGSISETYGGIGLLFF